MTPAEEIRAAAAKVRDAAAELLPVSTWWSTSPWISLMHPSLAEPLAALLDHMADIADYAAQRGLRNAAQGQVEHTLVVARALNGGA